MRLSTRRLEGVNRGECFWKCDGVAWMNVPAAREGDERSWAFAFAAGLMSTNRNCSVKTLGLETMDVLHIDFEERILIALI
jgi:hypothetical protein